MNKTLIALAIAAALPVAAQADATLSGSVSTTYTQGGSIETDAALSISSSEVLANGMTATATFDVLAGDNQGTASLAGDFGMLTIGDIDSDGAFQAGDVGTVVGDSTDADEDSTSVFGVHFAGTAAGLNIAAQVNASTAADATVTTASATTFEEIKGTQMSASYDLNGLMFGYAYTNAKASGDTVDGVMKAQNVFGVSYAFGDLVVKAGKSSVEDDTFITASYTVTMDALTAVAQMDTVPSGDYQINLTYAVNDALTLSAEIDDSETHNSMAVAYTAGDMTVSVSRDDEGFSDASVALDFGNADLSVDRDGSDAETSMTYTVAF
jgi:hypothetical protein